MFIKAKNACVFLTFNFLNLDDKKVLTDVNPKSNKVRKESSDPGKSHLLCL